MKEGQGAALDPPRTSPGKPWTRLLPLAAAVVVMVAILVTLGTWQLRRLAWKTGVLEQIASAEAAPAVPLPPEPSQFQKVAASGLLRTDLSVLYGADVRDTPAGPQMGAQLVTPLERPGAAPLLVVRGWVPTDHPRPPDAPPGPASFDGYVRAPERAGLFSPADDPGRRLFYTLDPAAIAVAVGERSPLPFALVALGPPPPPGAYPIPATSLPRPPNDHLSYAVTWYGLAVVCVVVFGTYALKRRREA